MPSSDRSARALWICAIITAISAAVSASFSIAGLLGDGSNDTYAMYAGSRSVALVLVSLGCLWVRWRAAVAAMGVTMGFVQMFDAMIGVHSHDASKTWGPLVFAVATFSAVAYLLRSTAGENGR
jgi:hypothetical protein